MDRFVQEGHEKKQGRHQESNGQSISPAEGKKVQDIGIKIEQEIAADDDELVFDKSVQKEEGEQKIDRVSQEVGNPEDEFVIPAQDIEKFGEERIEKMIIGGGAEVKDGQTVRGDIAKIGGDLINRDEIGRAHV
jgi:hypothetical protein